MDIPRSTSRNTSHNTDRSTASSTVPLPRSGDGVARAGVRAGRAEVTSALVGIRTDVAVFSIRPARLSASAETPGEPQYQFGVLLIRLPDGAGWSLPSAQMRDSEAAAVSAARCVHDAFSLLNLRADELTVAEVPMDEGSRCFAIGYAAHLSLADCSQVLSRPGAELALIEPGSSSPVVDGFDVQLPAGQRELIASAVERLRDQYSREPDPVGLLPDLFTLADLKSAHDAITGAGAFSRDAFRRVMEPQLVVVGERKSGSVGRPAKVYRRMDEGELNRPFTMPAEARPLPKAPAVDLAEKVLGNASRSDAPGSPAPEPVTASPAPLVAEAAPSKVDSHAVRPTSMDAQLLSIDDRPWLNELLAFASACLTVSEDPELPGHIRFGISSECTNERATEQTLILIDKFHELMPHSIVEVNSRRGPHRQRRTDLTRSRRYSEYEREMRARLHEVHDLGTLALVFIDIACVAPDPVLRFNCSQILRDVNALIAVLDETSDTGMTAYDVVSANGSLPDLAVEEIQAGIPVLLHMVGAEAVAFKRISERLSALAERRGAKMTRVTERIWFVAPRR